MVTGTDNAKPLNDDDEDLPTGQHAFDLDAAPSDAESDLEMQEDDEFDVSEEDEEANDSAFDSSEDEDAEMADADPENDPRTAHLRQNPIPPSDDEDAEFTTNLEDDLENDGYTLPAVESGGQVEEFERGTSLREVEGRMRWLVGVCMGKDEKMKGIPGK